MDLIKCGGGWLWGTFLLFSWFPSFESESGLRVSREKSVGRHTPRTVLRGRVGSLRRIS